MAGSGRMGFVSLNILRMYTYSIYTACTHLPPLRHCVGTGDPNMRNRDRSQWAHSVLGEKHIQSAMWDHV